VNVHLPRLGLGPFVDIPVDEFEELAGLDRFGVHHITNDAGSSDIVLFPHCHMLATDWRLTAIREHPLNQAHREKVMVYDERDRPWCAFPGVYISMPSRAFHYRAQRAWGYFRLPQIVEPYKFPDLLFSFIGSVGGNRTRQTLFELRHPSAVVEEVRAFTFYDPSSPHFETRRARYREIVQRSRFVLCPRGAGTSTFRMYEALSAGRVPVIVADDWVPPMGPDWETFSLRWPERQTRGLIETLEERDSDWPALSAAALQAYGEFFAPEVSFHRIVELCRELIESGGNKKFPTHGVRNRAFIASGLGTARWRVTTTLRRTGSRVLQAIGLRN
jgi:hypothetical protein